MYFDINNRAALLNATNDPRILLFISDDRPTPPTER